MITPSRPLRRHEGFVVRARFTAVPTPADVSTAFFITPDGSAMSAQPDLAHDIFPSNDHPSDKATFSFALDVPAGTVAVANGVRTGRRTRRGRSESVWVMRQPMTTQLIQVAVGDYDVTSRGFHRGLPVRDLTAPSLTAFLEAKISRVLYQLDWTQERFGRYPFDIYGSFVVNEEIGFALETQSLSIYDPRWFTLLPQGVWDPVMVHELTHQWFGDHVSVEEWSDLWLSEGHATWYEVNYAEEHGFLEEDTAGSPDENGYADLDDWMRAVYARGDQWRALYGPVALPAAAETLFSDNVYPGGALVLYALREKVGRRTFERIEREWLRRYSGESASTDDFIALASRISGRDLRGFLGEWVYGTTTPPMPNHPDWTVLPVPPEAAAARAPSAEPRTALRD